MRIWGLPLALLIVAPPVAGQTDRIGWVRDQSSGRRLKYELGDELYSIGTIALEGEWGFPGQPPEPVRQADPHSFETLLSRVGLSALLVDLRRARTPGHWLSQSIPGSLSAQVSSVPYPVVWPAVFDGVLFVRRMTAAGN